MNPQAPCSNIVSLEFRRVSAGKQIADKLNAYNRQAEAFREYCLELSEELSRLGFDDDKIENIILVSRVCEYCLVDEDLIAELESGPNNNRVAFRQRGN
jgi:hypothetical protein